MQMSTLNAAKAEKHLAKLIRINGKVDTFKNHIDSFHKSGILKLSSYETTKIKPLSRTAFNRATNYEQELHERKMKAGGMITVYLVNDFDLGKIAYDYANSLN